MIGINRVIAQYNSDNNLHLFALPYIDFKDKLGTVNQTRHINPESIFYLKALPYLQR